MNWEENKEKAVRVYALGKNDYVNEGLVKNTIKGKGFSIASALLGPAYFFFRKLYLWAVVLIVLNNFIGGIESSLKLSNSITMAIAVALFVVEGIMFYPLYQKQIQKDFEMVKDSPDWEQKLQEKGGTNAWLAFLGIILAFLVPIVCMPLIYVGILK